MKKIEKIKKKLLKFKPIEKRCKYIIKDKSISNTEKLRMLLNEHKKYFLSGEHRSAVLMEVYEIYYEKFTIDDHVYEVHRLPYEELCDKDICYARFIDLLSKVNILEFNYNELVKEEQEFVDFSKKFIQNCNDRKIDYSAFYYNKEFREDIAKKMDAVFSFIKNYNYVEKQEIEQTK